MAWSMVSASQERSIFSDANEIAVHKFVSQTETNIIQYIYMVILYVSMFVN